MKSKSTLILSIFVAATLAAGAAFANDTPTVAEQMAGLQQMCTDTAQARAQRQAERPLYDRLGGYEKINDFTREVVRLHKVNPDIKDLFEYVDSERLATSVADFASAGTGGPQKYAGRSMPAAHANLKLTDADFLSAGGDIITAMKTMGYGQDEIDEFVCILVSLKDQVILD
ncbi:MAG: group 1 truncated hemoglobin [Acidobacteria bacterium]|jgi:hemoglobin|nr:group 1 truncated hemoglobin [Acidobacteriota bacterium]